VKAVGYMVGVVGDIVGVLVGVIDGVSRPKLSFPSIKQFLYPLVFGGQYIDKSKHD